MIWEFQLGHMEFEMCVRYLSQEVIYYSWIYESGIQERGPSWKYKFRSCQSKIISR